MTRVHPVDEHIFIDHHSAATAAHRQNHATPILVDSCYPARAHIMAPTTRACSVTKTSQKVRPGERWWLDDDEERSKDRMRGRGWYSVYLAAVASAAAMLLVAAGEPCNTTPLDVASSASLPRRSLIWLRAGASSLVFAVIARRCGTTILTTKQTLDISPKRFILFEYSGVWRFEGLTQWQWMIIGAYCALAASIGLAVDSAPIESSWITEPSASACIARASLGVAFSLALLTNSAALDAAP